MIKRHLASINIYLIIASIPFNSYYILDIFYIMQMMIHRYRYLARLGLMHMIATNLAVWFEDVVRETLRELGRTSAENGADNATVPNKIVTIRRKWKQYISSQFFQYDLLLYLLLSNISQLSDKTRTFIFILLKIISILIGSLQITKNGRNFPNFPEFMMGVFVDKVSIHLQLFNSIKCFLLPRMKCETILCLTSNTNGMTIFALIFTMFVSQI